MDFIYKARELQIYSIRKAVGFPKRYTFYTSKTIADAATQIHEDVKRANSIFPLNQHEAQMRRDHLINANANLNNLVSQIEVAQEMFGIESNAVKYWMGLIDEEIRLVKAVMKRDKDRYRDLPE